MNQPTDHTDTPPDAIAIVGLAVRLPGADSVEAFWANLRAGRESVTFFSPDELRAAGVAPALVADARYVPANAVLPGADLFDAEFFGFTPREAEITDPQHRLFLEIAWEALERAGYNPVATPGRVGVFAGAGLSTYLLKNLAPNHALVEAVGELALLLGNNKDYVPTRTSYKLNLRGPSVAVNSACSTSLVAVHLAAQSLLDHQCDVALAGGVAVQVPQVQGYLHQAGAIGSPDGHCRAFDAAARGTVSGNGAGVVVLKRLADALADGDTIHAVILGSAVNNDGAAKVGFTAPSVEGQAQVIAEAQAVAGVAPEDISYIEAHGTGTELGDPIEVAALAQVFGPASACALGSVKTNFGHLDEAAGVAGLVKTVLALEHRELPPSLHFQTPNPKIDFAAGGFHVNARLTPWTAKPGGGPLRAGVSSFGIGGTNAHVVLEEAPASAASDPAGPWQLLVLSARTPAALERASANLAADLVAQPGRNLADVAFTLATGRRAFDHRRVVVARSAAEAAALLRTGEISAADAPREPGETGRRWAQGGDVDWTKFFAGQQRRRVVLPTYPFERKRYWIEAPKPATATAVDSPAAGLAADLATLEASEARLAADPALTETAGYPSFARALDAWCSAAVFHYVAAGAVGSKQTRAELRNRLGLQPAFRKFLDCFLQMLADDGYVRLEGEDVRWLREPATMPAPGAAAEKLSAQHPEFRGIVDLVRHCVSHYPEALTGKVPAITVLYPEGRSDLLEATGKATARHTNKEVYVGLLKEVIERRLASAGGRTLRILEVGVGDGLLAGQIAPALKGRNVSYVATDLSRAFVAKAEQAAAAAGLNFVSFGVFDISRDPAAQGFAPGSFDLVICMDVVHATPRLAVTLGHLRTLLAPGGQFGVIEKVRRERWVDLVWGLAEGWWYFEDTELRRHSPLLAASGWEQVLRGLDFGEVAVLPRDAAGRATTDYALLLAETPATTAKSVVPATRPSVDVTNWFHAPVWRQSAAATKDKDSRPILLLAEPSDLAERLAARLAKAGHAVARAALPASEAPEDWRKLFAAAAGLPGQIVYVAGTAHDLFNLQNLAVALGAVAREATISIISQRAWAVTPGEVIEPERALLAGPLRVIPLEFPNLVCRQIDVAATDETALGPLVAELGRPAREPAVALRGSERWVPVMTPRPLPPVKPEATGLRERGVYLITGALGSMGLALARELARSVRARLVLIGRSAPTPAQQSALKELEEQGAEILYVRADVADAAAMATAVRQAREKFGPIHGAIHTAGVYGQGLMRDRNRAAIAATLAPKVQGAQVLVKLLAGEPLDFLLFCSSLASLQPAAGQLDYCAANAFLDAFAADVARRTGVRAISIGWGMWQELGMMEHAAIAPAQQQAVRAEIEREGWADAGVAAFRRILAHGAAPHLVVSPQPVRLAAPPAHPLLSERRAEPGGRVDYVLQLDSRRDWLVNEHRLDGTAVLPGTAYLELARAAFADHAGAAAVELREVYFLSPLVFADGEVREVRVILTGETFRIVSRLADDRWLEHARGEVRAAPAAAPSAPVEEKTFESVPLPPDAVRFGPRWQNIKAVAFAGEAGRAELELAPEFADDLPAYGLHPALLDMATGFITLRHPLPDSLPFSYRRLVAHRPLPARFHSRVRVTAATATTLEVEAILTDEHGAVLVEIEGYRLRRTATPTAAMEPDNARLRIGHQGALDTLGLAPATRRAPGPGEVEIQVEAAGVNFVEVLYALGLLPAAPQLEDSFGLECAGRVVRVGAGVSGFAPGDAVIAYANGCFAAFVTTPATAVARRPAGLSAAEAATLPAAFATAHHALLTQGRLAAGERVLIHSAAGGVGQAAVQIAQRVGAEIFATAGSPEKRAFLRSLGVPHVMDSRSLDFADEVTRITGGRGVDVVLNSLGGEFLNRSLELVAPRGRFLELGKRDLFQGGRLDLAPFRRIISFIVVDVGPDLPDFPALWSEVARRVQSGEYRPLPRTEFPLTEAGKGFDFMARAKHTGKVVLTASDPGALLAAARAHRAAPAGRSLAAILGETKPAAAPAPASKAEAQPTGHARPELDTAYVAPTDPEETAIAVIWQDLLGIARVGVNDDFFDLQGDSLLAAQVMARVYSTLQVKLPLGVLFDEPTVARLAKLVRAARTEASSTGPAKTGAADGEEEGTL